MSLQVLLIGPHGHGGEEIYMRSLTQAPPSGVEYVRVGDFHRGANGAPCRVLQEILLNRTLAPLVQPSMGYRVLRVGREFDLVHVHTHPVRLDGLGGRPLVSSEGSSGLAYYGEYLGYPEARLRRNYGRARRLYGRLGIHEHVSHPARIDGSYVFSDWARSLNVAWGADPARMQVIRPGFDIPRPIPRQPTDTFTFLFVGRDFERKGGFEVLRAFAEVHRRHPSTRLMLIGDPEQRSPDREIHSWIALSEQRRVLEESRSLIAAGVIQLTPKAERERVYADFYSAADAFLMPSRAEGFGFTNVEAMGFALPVVTSRVGAMAEVVEEAETGWLVRPGDVAGLVSAMSALAADPARARAMGLVGRARFEERFTLERHNAALRALYDQALAGRMRAG